MTLLLTQPELPIKTKMLFTILSNSFEAFTDFFYFPTLYALSSIKYF